MNRREFFKQIGLGTLAGGAGVYWARQHGKSAIACDKTNQWLLQSHFDNARRARENIIFYVNPENIRLEDLYPPTPRRITRVRMGEREDIFNA